MIIGKEAVIKAMEEGKALDRIYLNNKAVGESISKLRQMSGLHGVPINYVPIEKINSFNVEHHDGCIAIISKIIELFLGLACGLKFFTLQRSQIMD